MQKVVAIANDPNSGDDTHRRTPPNLTNDGRVSTTIFAAYEDIQEGQLVVLFFLHRELNIREDGVEMFLECQHLIPFDDDEGIIHIPGPEFRFVVLEDQQL
ncbi:hypothetical protein SprV_0200644900 [Sparganum proliferum]